MNCTKCGSPIAENTKFCTKCGNPVGAPAPAAAPQQPAQPQVSQSVPASTPAAGAQVVQGKKLDFIKLILNVFIKPTETIEENKNELSKIGNAMILAGIVSGLKMIIEFLFTVFSKVFITDYFTGKKTIDFSYLKYINFFNITIKSLIIYFAAIMAVGGVFYLTGLIIKKELKFTKSTSIIAVGLLPYIAGSVLLAPIFRLIWNPLAIIVSAAGEVYSIVFVYELINNELNMDGDKKIIVNASVFAIIYVVALFILYYI